MPMVQSGANEMHTSSFAVIWNNNYTLISPIKPKWTQLHLSSNLGFNQG